MINVNHAAMNQRNTVAELAKNWVNAIEKGPANGKTEGTPPAIEELFDLPRENPAAAWRFILAVLASNPSEEVVRRLAAGPFEDFILYNGEQFFDEISIRVKQIPLLKDCIRFSWIDKNDFKRYQELYSLAGIPPPFK